ncbi:MAG: uracil-DNA glycosylase [Sphingobacteriia bacterium]|nr:uracil-DNA glycosylase [Sphingobacteriia bacterium]
MKTPDLPDGWLNLIGKEFALPYFAQLKDFLLSEKEAGYTIYPSGSLIFQALKLTPPEKVKVVIIGQDPYHGPGQAHGLCFSVPNGVPIPPSLRNIFKELHQDINLPYPSHGNLESWASQGVLLLNATLTVRANQPGTHQNKGWETFTDSIISNLSTQFSNLVFLLWGSYAQAKSQLISPEKHLILKAPHPSPLSAHRGFLGCKHFSKTNEWLIAKGKTPIIWG